ncbi:coagulation factor VII-like isoform X1 [Hemitrygon akajei]|uniref:coagulation factor VII-like isoform X1 n=1 Tax=Hemitrygon akajei TaxID=2704970 RepID=UPI003BFA03F4
MASLYVGVLVSWVLQLFCLTQSAVFLQEGEAKSVLHRRQRANKLLEELKRGSVERECFEEKCSREEAREVFDNESRMEEFWAIYTDGNQCASNPCQNGGTCRDQLKSYQCWCTENFEGWNCETEKIRKIKCIFENGYCEQFCNDLPHSSRECSCTEDYRLAEDGASCISTVQYPCGKAPRMNGTEAEAPGHLGRIVDGENAVKGESPWQIFLTYKGEFLCGAVLIAPQWVLTAAHCTHDKRREDLQIVAGEHVLNEEEGTEQKRNVSEMINHQNYNPKTVDNDIAMLKLDVPITLNDYAVPICLPKPDFAMRELTQIHFSTVSGWGRQFEGGLIANTLQILQVPVVWTSKCQQTTDYTITDNMFCAGYFEASKDTCKGDSGGPHVTKYKGTWFLTGIVSWGEGCARESKYGVYTKIHKYFHWIRQFLNPANLTLSTSFVNLTESSEPVTNISHVSFIN